MKINHVMLGSWILVCASVLVGCRQDRASQAGSTSAPVVGTVDLEVDFKSQRGNIKVAIPCSADSTVLTILERAQNIGDLEFESTGSGETAFVTSIGGVKNKAAAGENWVYRVNDTLGDKSCGLFSVKPGDRVFWTYGEYTPDE